MPNRACATNNVGRTEHQTGDTASGENQPVEIGSVTRKNRDDNTKEKPDHTKAKQERTGDPWRHRGLVVPRSIWHLTPNA